MSQAIFDCKFLHILQNQRKHAWYGSIRKISVAYWDIDGMKTSSKYDNFNTKIQCEIFLPTE